MDCPACSGHSLLITTIKYVYLALNADNKGEGGIFALYALVRRYKARLGNISGYYWLLHVDCRWIYYTSH
ncbi:MAG: KUP/HAK/KT family potassium transporter [Cytophagales bacterium]|nr:KUP/HAK/KT family potassium transporter [Cytophagales bacterium]